MNEVALHRRVFVVDRVALGFADLLDHDLLGRLGGDPAHDGGIDVFFAALGGDVAGLAIDGDGDLGFLAEFLERGQLER